MAAGRLVQVAPPPLLYREPASALVARFVGQGAVVPARVLARGDDGRCPVEVLGRPAWLRAPAGQPPGPVEACLRPEDLALGAPGEPGLEGTVTRAAYQGARTAVEIAPRGAPALRVSLLAAPDAAPAPGSLVRFVIRDGWVVPGPPPPGR
jgi:iron(III) transport system ATP-binding protein